MKLACMHCDRPTLVRDQTPIGWTDVLPIQPCNLAILKRDLPGFDGDTLGVCPDCERRRRTAFVPKTQEAERMLF